MLGGLDLQRILLVHVPQLGDVPLPEHRVVVEVHLRVQGVDIALRVHHQRVDLDQGSVGFQVGRHHAGHDRLDLARRAAFESEPGRDPPALERQHAEQRIDQLPQDRVGIRLGHVLDVHAARARCHQEGAFGGAVQGHAQVELPVDFQGFLDQHLAHLLAFGAGLVGHQLHAQDLTGQPFRLARTRSHLDAAALAATAGVNLRLDHAAAAEVLADRPGLSGVVDHLALGHRGAEPTQYPLGLKLVDLHGRRLFSRGFR